MTTEAASTSEEQVLDTTSTAAADAGTGTSTEANAADTGAANSPVRPDNLDDKFWDDATGLKVGDLVSHLRELEAKQADVPAEGEGYDLALPEGFEVPEGYNVEIAKEDPLWADFQAVAREHGIGKAAFGKFVGAFAKYQIEAQKAEVESYVSEKTALGPNADTRIKAAESYLKANLKGPRAEALAGALVTAEGVAAIEDLIRLKSGPVAATGVGAANTSKFEGTHGASRLAAIREQQAA